MNPYAARMKAMLIFAFFPLVVLLAQPLGTFSPWFPVILIGIGGAAHQSWSANIFSTVGDMFPKNGDCKYYRYRRYGGWRRFYADAVRRWSAVCSR